jgi:hypothetical protein
LTSDSEMIQQGQQGIDQENDSIFVPENMS